MSTTPLVEALHIALLAKVIEKNEYALDFYSQDEAIEMLEKKIHTYESIAHENP